MSLFFHVEINRLFATLEDLCQNQAMQYEHLGKLFIVTEIMNICSPSLLISTVGKLMTCLDLLGVEDCYWLFPKTEKPLMAWCW